MADTELAEQTGAQYEAAQENYGGEENNDDRKLFVGGLSPKTTTEDVRDYFGKFGEVADCTVKTDVYTGRSRGFGFVVFKDSSGMEAVLSYKEGHVIQGKTIDSKRAVPESGSESHLSKKIFVGGINDIAKEDIRVYFSEFGKVEDIFLPLDKTTGESKGFCFITFESGEVVDKILENPIQTIGGKEVDVKRSNPKQEGHSRGRGGYRGRGGGRGGRGGWGGYGGGYGGYNQGNGPNQGYGGYDQYGGSNYNQGYGGYGQYGGSNYKQGYGGYGGMNEEK